MRGIVSLNITQFGGAANDNILKQVLIFGVASGGIWADKWVRAAKLMRRSAWRWPFVLLSGFAGQFSDRYSKRDVSVILKLAEIAIALFAMWGLWMTNLWMVLASMILIAVQSTFFTPAKFGILPELVEERELSRVNGTINMFTYVAIILGGAIGGPLYDAYAPNTSSFPNSAPLLWLPGAIILAVAIVGAAGSLGLPRLTAQNPEAENKSRVVPPYLETWRDIARTPLASVIIAWGYFYLIVGGVAILILPDYKDLLKISATETAGLLALLGIAIGVGDFVAGRVSGYRIRPELISFGGIGTTIMFFVLAAAPLNYYIISVCLGAAGFFAGFVMVPLQNADPTTVEHRGTRTSARAMELQFVRGIILGNILFLVITKSLDAMGMEFQALGCTWSVADSALSSWRPTFCDGERSSTKRQPKATRLHEMQIPPEQFGFEANEA